MQDLAVRSGFVYCPEMDSEEWRVIGKGILSRWLVSSMGRMRGPRGIMACPPGNHGYPVASLHVAKGRTLPMLVHRLVLTAFVGECPDGHEARHLNGIRTDCRLENLAWGTWAENHDDKVRHGRFVCNKAFADADVTRIRAALRDGASTTEVANRYGVSVSTITNVDSGRTYADIPGCRRQYANRGSGCHNAALTEDIVRDVRVRAQRGESMLSMARELGVSKGAVRMAVRRLTWRWVQ